MRLLRVVSVVALGALEGAAFALCGVVVPFFIESQMSFHTTAVLKLFLSAVGSSMVAQGLWAIIHPKKFAATRNFAGFSWAYPRVVGGCAILGAGMCLAGSGPTMIPSQLALVPAHGIAVIIGVALGGAAYDFVYRKVVEPAVSSRSTNGILQNEKPWLVMEDVVGGSYASIALPFGAALLGVSWVVEKFFVSHATDTSALSPIAVVVPTVVGMVIGVNQVALRALTGFGMGGSYAPNVLLSIVTGGRVCPSYYPSELDDLWQVIYVWVGTFLGAAGVVAIRGASTIALPATGGATPATAVLGGAMMIVGARIAGGCTCGHGITGFSELNLRSMAGAMSIFGGGMLTAVLRSQ